MKIIPAILAHNPETFLSQLQEISKIENYIQIDVTDGIFVSPKNWFAAEILQNNLAIETEMHLMVAEPLLYIKELKNNKYIKKYLVHFESLQTNLTDFLTAAKKITDAEIGLVLNPETSLDILLPEIANLNTVMFMTVYPGRQGQQFLPESLQKAAAFKKSHPNIFVQIDGGVNENNILVANKTGIDAVCVGSAIFGNQKTPEENIKHLSQLKANTQPT